MILQVGPFAFENHKLVPLSMLIVKFFKKMYKQSFLSASLILSMVCEVGNFD